MLTRSYINIKSKIGNDSKEKVNFSIEKKNRNMQSKCSFRKLEWSRDK